MAEASRREEPLRGWMDIYSPDPDAVYGLLDVLNAAGIHADLATRGDSEGKVFVLFETDLTPEGARARGECGWDRCPYPEVLPYDMTCAEFCEEAASPYVLAKRIGVSVRTVYRRKEAAKRAIGRAEWRAAQGFDPGPAPLMREVW